RTGPVDAPRAGPAAIDAAAEAQRKMGEIPGPPVEQAQAYAAAQKRLSDTFAAIRMDIGAALLPVLTPIVEATQQWVVTNRELLQQDISGFVTGLGEAFKRITPFFQEAVDAFKAVQQGMDWLDERLAKAPEAPPFTAIDPANFYLAPRGIKISPGPG